MVIAVAAVTIALSLPGCMSEPELDNYPVVSFSNDINADPGFQLQPAGLPWRH